eukprot:Pgem_evm1s4025
MYTEKYITRIEKNWVGLMQICKFCNEYNEIDSSYFFVGLHLLVATHLTLHLAVRWELADILYVDNFSNRKGAELQIMNNLENHPTVQIAFSDSKYDDYNEKIIQYINQKRQFFLLRS